MLHQAFSYHSLSYLITDLHILSYNVKISRPLFRILSYLKTKMYYRILKHPGLCLRPASPSQALAHVDPEGSRAVHQDANLPRRWGGIYSKTYCQQIQKYTNTQIHKYKIAKNKYFLGAGRSAPAGREPVQDCSGQTHEDRDQSCNG